MAKGESKKIPVKKPKKGTSSTMKYVLIAAAVAIGALVIYSLTQSKSLNDLKKQNSETSNSNNVKNEEEEFEEYQIPTLEETQKVNQALFDESVKILIDKYNIQNSTDADNLVNQVGMLFNILEVESIPAHFRNNVNDAKSNRDLQQPFLGIYRDDFYCIKSDLYHLTHENELYNNITLFSDWGDQYTREDIFGNFSTVASPMYGWDLPAGYLQRESFALELNISSYYLNRPKILNSFALGKQYGCLFQGLNKIPSSGAFTRKEGLARNYKKFIQSIDQINNNPNSTQKYSEKCMQEFNFLPNTYNLNKADECKEFFTYIQSQEYAKKHKEEGFQFISKLGANVHQGKGINVLTSEITTALLKKYDNGRLCGSIGEENPELVQGYLNDPLLLNGVKFEVRMHFVVASINPLIIYAQDKGGVAFCALKYDSHESQIQRHLCVYNIARRLLELNDEELFKISGKTREQFMNSFSYQHTLDSLQVELEKEGSVKPGWVRNSFVPAVYRNFIHTLLFSRSYLQEDSRFYEMYAPDILVDRKTLQPYILEYNTNPRMVNTSSFVHDWNLSTIKDIVLINMAQVRSRYFRIKKIVEEYMQEVIDRKNPNPYNYIKRLLKANVNKVEPQFNVDDKLTSYVKIFDESDPNDIYYQGNLIFNKECAL